jgi:hypothetical protein
MSQLLERRVTLGLGFLPIFFFFTAWFKNGDWLRANQRPTLENNASLRGACPPF